jgi:hypothetical protein
MSAMRRTFSGPFMTGAASSAVPVRTLLEWNVDDPLPDVARRYPRQQ